MPWDAILSGATGGVAVAIIIGVVLLKSLTEKIVESAAKRFERPLREAEELHQSTLRRADELYMSTLDLQMTVDTDLRNRRIPVYSELWKKTGVLPKWPRNRELTYADLQSLSNDFRKWYFETGGMYLSNRAREAYGEVQKSLTSTLEKGVEGKVSDPDYDTLQKVCSKLRGMLTHDLLSRREAPDIESD